MKIIQYFILLFFLIAIISCNRTGPALQDTADKADRQEIALKQAKEDLLAGVTKAVCYSGYRSGQHPDRGDGAVNPSYEETLEDLKILSGKANFKLIRIYDSGENSEMILNVIKENNIDMKVLLGIWLKAELSNHETCEWLTESIPEAQLKQNKKLNLIEIDRGISLANKYQDIIIAVNVGNEALVDWNDHKVDTDTIISYVQKVKQSIRQKVTVADNYKWWADHGENLAKAVDFISIHTYPVWEEKDILEGLSYTIANIKEVRSALPEAKIVITEAGWPTQASEFPNRVSEEIQQQYFNEILLWSKENNFTTFIFEAFDEDWKGNPDNILGAEKHWGLFTIDRKPKKVMEQFFAEQK